MMNKQKIINWLYIQKEGALVGGLWGLISIPAALGLATKYTSLTWYHKLLVLPVYLSGLLPINIGIATFAIPILIGMMFGIIVDMYYKPKE